MRVTLVFMNPANSKIISKLYFGLLPTQILLLALSAVSGIITTLFASNVIGSIALSAVGVYNPVYLFLCALSAILLGGSQILCGKFLGMHQIKKMQSVFSLNMILALLLSVIFTVLMFVGGYFDLTGFLASDEVVRHEFNLYIIGLAGGVIPFLLSQQLFAFLTLEQQNSRLFFSSVVYIVSTVFFTYLFLCVFPLGTFGLGLSGAAGNWVFLISLLPYFFSKDCLYKLRFKEIKRHYLKEMIACGLPGAMLRIYQTVSTLIANTLLLAYVGADGLAAVSSVMSLVEIFWAVPEGMEIVARVLFSVSVGEEDKHSLTDIMRTVIFKSIPLIAILAAVMVCLAVPFTNCFYHDPSLPEYQRTVAGFRIIPICLPFAVLCLSFETYAEASGKHVLAHIATALYGVIIVSLISIFLIPRIGVQGFMLANVIGWAFSFLIFLFYAVIKYKHFPKTMEEWMVIPKDFGVDDKDRMDISVQTMDDVVRVSEMVQQFCESHGVKKKKAFYAALCMEEMAGNVVSHGFTKDNKNHSVDIRVSYKEDTLILRIKDDCIQFDPAERKDVLDPDDICKIVGIRMVYQIANDIEYQNMLGLNVLTIRLM